MSGACRAPGLGFAVALAVKLFWYIVGVTAAIVVVVKAPDTDDRPVSPPGRLHFGVHPP